METDAGEEFLISRGGPFYELQRQLGLIREQADRVVQRATIFVVLTAVVPLVLELLSRGPAAALNIVWNPDFLARFVVFVVIAITMERSMEERLQEFLKRFDRSGLLGPKEREEGARAVSRALRLRNSWVAEAVCLALAILLSTLPILSAASDAGSVALLLESAEDPTLTPAGWWILIISSPLFWFLALRWLWRIALWSLLLHWISRLDLRLVATHPDKSGGIAFVGKYPNAFAPIVLGFGFVVAAIVFRQLASSEMSLETYGFVMSAWLAIVLAAFLVPLTSFVFPLAKLKEATLKEADAIDTRLQRENERKVLGRNLVGPEDDAASEDEDAPSDPSSFRKAANALRLRPFSREAVVPLGVAALAPLLIAGSSILPFKELLSIAKKLLLL